MTRVEDAPRTHVPELEQAAWNQMPKDNGWIQLKLWRFDGTNLYQWRGHAKMKELDRSIGAPHYCAWDNQATEVFMIIQG